MIELNTKKIMVSVKEAAGLLDESEDNIREWLGKGVLTGERTAGGQQGNWRVHVDCLRRFIQCRAFLRKFTDRTQVFWVTWKDSPHRTSCEVLKDHFRRQFQNESNVKDADCIFPVLMRGGVGALRPEKDMQ
jgi:hypothetical protein